MTVVAVVAVVVVDLAGVVVGVVIDVGVGVGTATGCSGLEVSSVASGAWVMASAQMGWRPAGTAHRQLDVDMLLAVLHQSLHTQDTCAGGLDRARAVSVGMACRDALLDWAALKMRNWRSRRFRGEGDMLEVACWEGSSGGIGDCTCLAAAFCRCPAKSSEWL